MTRVVKVGGSLFDWPGLAAALGRWLDDDSAAATVLLAGGGELADVLRRADATHGLGETVCHWLCVDTLRVSARWLAQLPPTRHVTSNFQELFDLRSGARVVFDPVEWMYLQEAGLPGAPLPHGWHVTTDSIAARLAQTLGAEELVLLKSAPPPARSRGECAAQGYVDEHFPRAASSLARVRCVALRNPLATCFFLD